MLRFCLAHIAILAFALGTLLSAPVSADATKDIFDQPMAFTLAENAEHGFKWVAAFGAITVDTPMAFEVFARKIKTKGMWIEFNSAGGKVVPALILGELIRKHGFNTDVALTRLRGHGKDSLFPGFCMSACGYAFLGGVRREVQDGSVLGYHDFYLAPEFKDKAVTIDRAKITEFIETYMLRMGVDKRLLALAAATEPTDYYEPNRYELLDMRIVTGGGRPDTSEPDSNAKQPGASQGGSGKQSRLGPVWRPPRGSISRAV